MSLWWALAVVDRGPLAEHVSGPRLAALPALAGEAALIAAELPALPTFDVDTLRWHDALVRALAAPGRSCLPVRFGAHASDPSVLIEGLRGRERAIADALSRVRDAAQITVRARNGPPLEVAPEPDDASAGPGARFLRQRARERAPRPPGWAALSAPLRAHVRDERIQRGDPRLESWRAYHLVERSALDAYRAACALVHAGAPEWDLAFGEPSPPYAFAAEVVS